MYKRSEEKCYLRKLYIEKRKNAFNIISVTLIEKAVNLLKQWDLFQSSEHIACYYAVRNEFPTQSLITAIWQAKKQCYLPHVYQDNLVFVPYHQHDELVENIYSIPEPDLAIGFMSSQKLDIIILPLIAFDFTGNRLGMGGGYYDKTLNFLINKSKNQRPFLLGVGFSQQYCNALPCDKWDVKLDGVLTEQYLKIF